MAGVLEVRMVKNDVLGEALCAFHTSGIEISQARPVSHKMGYVKKLVEKEYARRIAETQA